MLVGNGAGYSQLDKLRATFGKDIDNFCNIDPVPAQLLNPASLAPGIGDLTKIMVERYKAKTNANDVPPHCSMGFNQTWVLLNNVLPVAKEKYGGFDAEAVRKAALDVDIPAGGTIQGYGVKFYRPGTPALRPERALDAGRHAECRRAHLGGLAEQHQDAGTRAAAAGVVRLRHALNDAGSRGLSKRFGGFLAVNQVSFEVREGEILGLIGPNGSGKSTTFNLIAGTLRPTAGSIRFEGEEIASLPAHTICRRGIARTFQIPRPFRKLSLLENVTLAAYYGEAGGITRAEAHHRAEEALGLVGLPTDAAATTNGLGAAALKKLELARALATKPRLLLADESLGGLDSTEMERAADMLESIRSRMGMTIIWVEHIMGVLMRIVDRVIVLDHGEKIFEGAPAQAAIDPRVDRGLSRQGTPLSPMLSLAAVSAGYGSFRALFDVSLEVPQGEAVGVIGPNGAGKTTLDARHFRARAAARRRDDARGPLRSAGFPAHRIVELGIAHVPENRRLFPRLTVEDNLAHRRLHPAGARGISPSSSTGSTNCFRASKERREQLAGTLSGGEQQMCAIGRALMSRPKLLLMDEPSAGLAPLVVEQVFDLVRRIRAEGLTVLIVEQNVQQVLDVVDRAYLLEVGSIKLAGTSSDLKGHEFIRKAYMGL